MSGAGSVSIIIPTYNEAENIVSTIRRAVCALSSSSIKYEILVVDDNSPDGTARIAGEALAGCGKVIIRINRQRSLSLSVLEGIKQAAGDIILVMDGDGNHPPEMIPALIAALREGHDLAIASRYVKGGRSQERLTRRMISRFSCYLGRVVTGIKDNTSGFFCISKDKISLNLLAPVGFKIGLEIFVKSEAKSVAEIPFTFMSRIKGKSKLGAKVVMQYIYQLGRLLIYKNFVGICRYFQ